MCDTIFLLAAQKLSYALDIGTRYPRLQETALFDYVGLRFFPDTYVRSTQFPDKTVRKISWVPGTKNSGHFFPESRWEKTMQTDNKSHQQPCAAGDKCKTFNPENFNDTKVSSFH